MTCCAEDCRGDLRRDEEIFAVKVRELGRLRKEMTTLERENAQLRQLLASATELDRESTDSFSDDASEGNGNPTSVLSTQSDPAILLNSGGGGNLSVDDAQTSDECADFSATELGERMAALVRDMVTLAQAREELELGMTKSTGEKRNATEAIRRQIESHKSRQRAYRHKMRHCRCFN